jgi:DNA primase
VRLSYELRKSLEAYTRAHQATLAEPEGQAALGYLYGRGIGDELIARYRLGAVGASSPEYPGYAGMVSIPYLTRLGGVCAIKFRRPHDGDGPKYLAPVGQATRIYNSLALDYADVLGYVAICEGEFDAICLTDCVGIPAVGIPGAETWKAHPEWRELFRGYDKVYMFPDDDEAGRGLEAAVKADVDQCQSVSLGKAGKDVSDALRAAGAPFIRKAAGL